MMEDKHLKDGNDLNDINDMKDRNDSKGVEDLTENVNDEEKNVSAETMDTTGKNREVIIDVHMNAGVLYDYMLNHSYSGASGILGTCFGFLGIVAFAKTHFPLYLIMGLLLIFYLPVHLRYRAAMQMQLTEAFKKPLHYVVDSEGISVSQGEQTEHVSWDQCLKAVSTRKSIVVYTGKKNATIFPRKDLGEYTGALIAVIVENMDPKRVKIRF